MQDKIIIMLQPYYAGDIKISFYIFSIFVTIILFYDQHSGNKHIYFCLARVDQQFAYIFYC
jgi:hypothetical protein